MVVVRSHLNEDFLKPGLILSCVLHGVLVLVLTLRLASSPPKLPEQPILIPIDVVTLGSQTSAPKPKPLPLRPKPSRPAPPPEPEPEPTPEPVIDEIPDAVPPPKPFDVPPPEETPLPEKPKKEKPKDKVEPPKEPKKKEVLDKKEKSKAKKETPKTPPKKNPPKKQKAVSLDSLLESDDGGELSLDQLIETDVDSKTTAVASTIGELSVTAQDLIKREIQRFWNPTAIQGRDVPVTVVIHLAQDGTVTDARIDPEKSATSHPDYRAAADLAMRAVRDPRLRLPLPRETYSQWKELALPFNPKGFKQGLSV